MSQAPNRSSLASAALSSQQDGVWSETVPFAGTLDAILVEDPVLHPFAGSVSRSHAIAIWRWVKRDLCADLLANNSPTIEQNAADEIAGLVPEWIARIKTALEHAETNPDTARRLRVSLGSQDIHQQVPVILVALRQRALLGKAQDFGRAINAIAEDASLGSAIQSMPLQDPQLAALLFHAAVGQVANPSRVTAAIAKLAGNSTEKNVDISGCGPVVDAMLAHAQNQIHLLQSTGPFADIDQTCQALERFHRLIRALTGYIEFSRGSGWSAVISALTKQVSERIEPRLRTVLADINQSLRQARDGHDRLDNDRLLAAINGVYLLATIRECRDSLALNALFDQAWMQSGQALEMHLQRNLDVLRQDNADASVLVRLEAGIKMAEVRFNPEYAETLRRARAAALRRV